MANKLCGNFKNTYISQVTNFKLLLLIMVRQTFFVMVTLNMVNVVKQLQLGEL